MNDGKPVSDTKCPKCGEMGQAGCFPDADEKGVVGMVSHEFEWKEGFGGGAWWPKHRCFLGIDDMLKIGFVRCGTSVKKAGRPCHLVSPCEHCRGSGLLHAPPPTCPCCDETVGYYPDADGIYVCDRCGEEFRLTIERSGEYTTSKIGGG